MYNPNMLKTFLDCPKKYYLKYVRQIQAPVKSEPFEKGKKIHALANYYLRGDDISKFEKVLSSDEALTWNILKNNEYFNKTYINSEYNLSCKTGDYWIGGRLDALVKDENRYFILDYKTGSIPKNPEFDVQTMIYLLCADKFFDADLSFVYIDLKNNKNYRIDLTDEMRAKYTDELLKIITTVEKSNFPQKSACKFCEYKKVC